MAVDPIRLHAVVYATAVSLAADPGPSTSTRYAVVLDLGARVFSWSLGNTDTIDSVTCIGHNGGSIGRWKVIRDRNWGADLADAAATIYPSGKEVRVLPAATLTANRILTLGTTSAAADDELWLVRNDTSAFTFTISNGGAGAGTVAVMPVSVRAWCRVKFDGTNWVHIGSGMALGTA